MQVFLPFPSFIHSVAVLDRARLGKQRVECDQILRVLAAKRAPTTPGGAANAGWANHPAVRMWEGHSAALGVYMTLCVWEWQARGYQSGMILPYSRDRARNDSHAQAADMADTMDLAVPPPWLGREDVHASHRGRLLHKYPEHYGQLGWTDAPRTEEEGYIWPVA